MSSTNDTQNYNNTTNTNNIRYATLSCPIPANYFGPDIITAYGNQVIVAIDASGRVIARSNACDGKCEFEVVHYKVTQ